MACGWLKPTEQFSASLSVGCVTTYGFSRNYSLLPVIRAAELATNFWREHLSTRGVTGATNKALITFTFNIVSQGLYIRHGIFFPASNLSFQRGAGRVETSSRREITLHEH